MKFYKFRWAFFWQRSVLIHSNRSQVVALGSPLVSRSRSEARSKWSEAIHNNCQKSPIVKIEWAILVEGPFHFWSRSDEHTRPHKIFIANHFHSLFFFFFFFVLFTVFLLMCLVSVVRSGMRKYVVSIQTTTHGTVTLVDRHRHGHQSNSIFSLRNSNVLNFLRHSGNWN